MGRSSASLSPSAPVWMPPSTTLPREWWPFRPARARSTYSIRTHRTSSVWWRRRRPWRSIRRRTTSWWTQRILKRLRLPPRRRGRRSADRYREHSTCWFMDASGGALSGRPLAIGVDFGTINSSIARAGASGEIELARFSAAGGMTDAYRSLLYLEQLRDRGAIRIKSWSGPTAIEEYLSAETKGRLVQSLKSFLSSRSLKSTDVFGRRLTLEDLIARILRDLREKAEAQFGSRIRSAVVGRPVRFVGADQEEDNRFAEERLIAAFHLAGFESVEFELEPVAAAYYYESTLDHDELILIGDFGGGTSDFSLLRVGPSIRKRGRTAGDLLGNSGIGIAGDAFDARIVRNLVSPALGRGSSARSRSEEHTSEL